MRTLPHASSSVPRVPEEHCTDPSWIENLIQFVDRRLQEPDGEPEPHEEAA